MVTALVVLVLTLAGAALSIVARWQGGGLAEDLTMLAGFAAFGVVGSIILIRRPGHPIGWLFGLVGPLASLAGTQDWVAQQVLAAERAGDQVPGWVIWLGAISQWTWYPILAIALVLIPSLYPTGRPLSRRWGAVLAIPVVVFAIGTVLAVLTESYEICVEACDGEGQPVVAQIENPVGVGGVTLPEDPANPVGAVLNGVAAVGVPLALISLVVRFRRSTGVERLQLKWLMFAFGLVVTFVVLDELGLLGSPTDWGDSIYGLLLGGIPVAAGVAITRYRLYEIDRLVSRTVSYALMVMILAGVYAGGVFVLRNLLPLEGDVAVAASTLAVAALFAPVRRRARLLVDRRFDRARYDARQVVDRLAERTRQGVDMETMARGVVAAVDSTLRPASTSLWLRSP